MAVDRQELEDISDPVWNVCKENGSVMFVPIQVNFSCFQPSVWC